MFLQNVIGNYAGISREAKYLIYSTILPSVAYGMLFTDLPYFLPQVQGITTNFTGLVMTLMGVSATIASIFLGIVADFYGRKRMLIGGNILASIVIVVFALTTSPILLLTAAIFEGIAEAAVIASSSALLAEKVDHYKRNSVFSLYGFAQSIAWGIGGFAIPVVLIFEFFGFTTKESHIILYLSFAILSLVSTLLILKVGESTKLRKLPADRRDLFSIKSKKILLKYVLTGAIIAFGAGMVVPLMSLWFKLRYNIPDIISGPILGVSSLLIALATLVSPMLAKKFGLIKGIVITQIASTIFMFLTPLSPDFALAGFVYSIRALLMNMASPLSQSMIMGLVPEEERGAVSGISGALWRLPNALSTWVGAGFMSIGLLSEPFYLASLLYVISITLFWYFFRNVKMPEEQIGKSLCVEAPPD